MGQVEGKSKGKSKGLRDVLRSLPQDQRDAISCPELGFEVDARTQAPETPLFSGFGNRVAGFGLRIRVSNLGLRVRSSGPIFRAG